MNVMIAVERVLSFPSKLERGWLLLHRVAEHSFKRSIGLPLG
jgi:hypothetical protein